METLKTNINSVEKSEQNNIKQNQEGYKTSVINILNNTPDELNKNTTKQLEYLFNLTNENEINDTEAQLASMFSNKTYNNMLKLAEKEKKQPISLSSVMNKYDEYESRVAA